MKKMICFLMLFSILSANPLISLNIEINELMFDENGDWTLELRVSVYTEYARIKSVMLYNTYDSAQVISIPDSLDTNELLDSLFIVSKDSLSKPIEFLQNGDSVGVRMFFQDFDYHYWYEKRLIYGDFKKAVCNSPEVGYSIQKCCYDFYIINTTSLGEKNSSPVMNGSLQGYVYLNNGQASLNAEYYYPYYKAEFTDINYMIRTDSTGFYSTKVYSNNFSTDCVYARYTPLDIYYIEPISYKMEPDSVINCDIHLITSGIENETSIPDKMKISVTNYPNPFNPETTFKVQNLGQNDINKAVINIYNIKGELVNSLVLNSNAQTVWNGRNISGKMMSAGVYVYRLMVSEDLKASGSMVFLK